MVILSLFDGMSCGQIALSELGIPIDRYYASEIDKHAIAQTKLNFPDTIHLGDVEGWREWDIDWSSIDLILAGSPCQGFSIAGKQLGLEDPRSRLFWVFVDILEFVRERNPQVRYLLENVRMKPEHERIINEALGLLPVVINSALVSAQNRVRLYWTNIRTKSDGLFGECSTDISQPDDRGIAIGDVLENEVDEKFYLSKSGCEWIIKHGVKKNKPIKILGYEDKSSCLTVSTTTRYNLGSDYILQRPRGGNRGVVFFDKSPTLTSCSYENNNILVKGGVLRTHHDGRGFRPFVGNKFGTLTARAREDGSGQLCVELQGIIRRLTPTECARLQTIPSWYEWGCSDSQAYKMLGNGWTVEVIKHIIKFINQ